MQLPLLHRYFYPRSPCGERRTQDNILHVLNIFLSTLSLRRATLMLNICAVRLLFLSTLSLRRATAKNYTEERIKIFLSTLSLRRATNYQDRAEYEGRISIHALLAESDLSNYRDGLSTWGISIHALLAESDKCLRMSTAAETPFLSTLSLRRATVRFRAAMT